MTVRLELLSDLKSTLAGRLFQTRSIKRWIEIVLTNMAILHAIIVSAQWHRPDPVRGGAQTQNYVKVFVAHKMAQNNTPNKVHYVAATELP